MKHVHHDLIVEWAADPSRVVECQAENGEWVKVSKPVWYPNEKYRFKPAEQKYIVVNGVNVPEPVREPLGDCQQIWLADICTGKPSQFNWMDTTADNRWLSLGLIHLTKEAAQAHIDAMLLPSRTDK